MDVIAIDQGTRNFRAGLAGDDIWRMNFAPLVCSNDKQKYMLANNSTTTTSIAPMDTACIINLEMCEFLYAHMFANVNVTQRNVILSESTLTSKKDRTVMTQLMFEQYNSESMYLAMDDMLALYAAGRTSGLLVNVGMHHTRCSLVQESCTVRHASLSAHYGGQSCTDYFTKLAMEQGMPVSNMAWYEQIKEQTCQVAKQFDQYEYTAKAYQLPDGSMISVQHEQYHAPEALFQPAMMQMAEEPGIHELIYTCLHKVEHDYRRELWLSIVIAGGRSMFPGMPERVERELVNLAPSACRVKITAPPARDTMVWIGASIFGSISTYEECAITSQEYEEMGPNIVHRKCT